MIRLLFIAGVFGGAYAIASAAQPDTSAGPVLVVNGMKSIPLREVGAVAWRGEHMNGETMSVFCADGGFVFGVLGPHVIGLNGYSASFRGDGKVRFAKGAPRTITTTDKRDLVAIGAVTAAAEPLVYNTVAGEGLKMGRAACP